jgi:hypothetical protein
MAIPGFVITTLQPPKLARSLTLLILLGFQAFAQAAARDTAQDEKTAKPSPPSVRIVFFTPSDLTVPDGVQHRLTKIADAADKFFIDGMKRWGYPPAVESLFRREPDGSVEVLKVRGEQPVASGKHAKPNYAEDVINRATQKYRVTGKGDVWWIFVYIGDRPARFNDFAGAGNPRNGGWAMVNYDTIPGEISPDLSLVTGFNGQFFLKGAIHELGHAFGLPHVGPNLALDLGNSLMGPTTAVYAKRKLPKADQVYLNESSAAMLWKHPIFSGTAGERFQQPSVKLLDYKAKFSPADDRVTISGKLVADQPAHSVIVVDDQGRPNDEYWRQSHTARIAPDGTFLVTIDKPLKVDGQFRIVFCFENGLVTGDGAHIVFGNRGDVRKSYRGSSGDFQFGD